MRLSAVWRWPLLLAGLTLFGLLSALLGEGGMWWVLSWIALATPLVVAVVCLVRSRSTRF
jgi:dolichyl-phosphate-mannose--protein O-mannosyl transferase